MHVMLLQGLNMRGIRTQAVFSDDHFEMGVILTKFGDKTLGGVALAIIFLGAILFDNRLGHQRNDFTLIGVDEGCTQELMGIGSGAVSMMFFQTPVAVALFGGKIARAIEGQEIMALDKDHLFKGFATLKLTKNPCKRRSQVFRLDRIEYLAH